MIIVKVLFENCDKKYLFNCDEELNVSEWDVVVVDTVKGLQTAVVTDVRNFDKESPCKPKKWVVDKVNPRKIQRAKINAKINSLEKQVMNLKDVMKAFDEELFKESVVREYMTADQLMK